jgi:SAM-dependent methyltransferase
MRESSIQYFRSPGSGLKLSLKQKSLCDGDEIVGGTLADEAGTEYPIVAGVPRFVASQAYTSSFGFEWKQFSRTQLDSASGRKASETDFINKTGWSLEQLRGARILDAGCGMGRYSEVALRAGAKVVCGIDLSQAVESAHENLRRYPQFVCAQASILDAPFEKSSFDCVFSIGVLHHTPNTRRSFLTLAEYVRPGGEMAVYIYSGEWKNRINCFFSDCYRVITKRLPPTLLFHLCKLCHPIYRWHKFCFRINKYLGIMSHTLLPISMQDDPQWRLLDTFDWYSPWYQWKHTFAEVESWFAEAGFVNVRRQQCAVCVTGTKR